jgi:DNA replication and repair protein RecF
MITNLRLQHFRSYSDESFEFEPGVNVIVGPNASGKTNLLEALLVLARGKSYRAGDADLLQYDQDWARLDADIAHGHRTVKLQNEAGRITKQYEIEGQKYTRLTSKNMLPVVVFEPNHLAMLGGTPELRRAFIDDLNAQTMPGHDTTLRHYRRALQQRNRLLKQGPQAAHSQLFAWDLRLSELGAQVVAARHITIKLINRQLEQTYNSLAGQNNTLAVSYSNETPPDQYASHLLKRLEGHRDLDLIRGFTAAGPHREDLLFVLNGQPLATTASRGETRTTLLSLKILELAILEEQLGQKPLLLLDDVFSELDGARRKALTTAMKNYQTFITTTDADVVMKHFAKRCNIIPVTKG